MSDYTLLNVDSNRTFLACALVIDNVMPFGSGFPSTTTTRLKSGHPNKEEYRYEISSWSEKQFFTIIRIYNN